MMFKRVRWMGMGAVAGVGAVSWAQRRVRRTLDEHPAIAAGASVASTARLVGKEVAAAVGDGRRAMAEREAALRTELAARNDPNRNNDPNRRVDANRRSLNGRSLNGRNPTGGTAARVGAAGIDPARRPAFPGAPGSVRAGAGVPRLRVVDATTSDVRDGDGDGQGALPARPADRRRHPTAGRTPLHLEPPAPDAPARPSRRRRGS